MERPIKSKRQLKPRELPLVCLCCGGSNPWVVNTVSMAAPFRGQEHSIQAVVNQCRHCDTVVTSEEQSASILLKIREVHAKWISEKLKRAQKNLSLSLRELVQKTDIPFSTWGRASAGEHLIEATTEKLIWVELDRLTQEKKSVSWFRFVPTEFTVTDGSVLISNDREATSVYALMLKSTAESSHGYCNTFGWDRDSRTVCPLIPVPA